MNDSKCQLHDFTCESFTSFDYKDTRILTLFYQSGVTHYIDKLAMYCAQLYYRESGKREWWIIPCDQDYDDVAVAHGPYDDHIAAHMMLRLLSERTES